MRSKTLNHCSTERSINTAELENLSAIFDRDRIIESDEDLLDLAQYVEDESDEKRDTWVDDGFDLGDRGDRPESFG